jgi:hypothetical protein
MDRKNYNAERLQELFSDFNNRYFDGKLQRYRIQVVRRVSERNPNLRGKLYRKRRLIRIGMSGEETMITTLCHEMAHAANRTDGHGPKFLQIMKELKSAGAPIADFELEDPYGRKGLTMGFFRESATDALLDVPDATLSQVARWFINDNGYASSITGLLRRYPWIPRVFREAKRSRR